MATQIYVYAANKRIYHYRHPRNAVIACDNRAGWGWIEMTEEQALNSGRRACWRCLAELQAVVNGR